MTPQTTRFSARFVTVAILLTLFTACAVGGTGSSSKFQPDDDSFFTIDLAGNLTRPDSYREWVYVGTPVTPDELNNGKAPFPEFHNVYIDPVSYRHWKEHGKWREGTTLIKELVSVGSKRAVSGKGYFMGNYIGLEATIKSKQHFPDEPGNWAYFSFTNPGKTDLKMTAKPFATKDCNSCHDSSAKDDFVFTQYYPRPPSREGIWHWAAGADREGIRTRESSGRRRNRGQKAVDGKWQPSAPTPKGAVGGIPLGKEELFAYLKSGTYKSFKNRESKPHASEGPHTSINLPVRVFMNDTIAASLTAKNTNHPRGSAIVKEMFSSAGKLAGWAVMVKTQKTTDSGKGWFWYEVTSAADASKLAAMGNGVSGCASCHRSGDDMVLTQFPLR